jgi:hypothetical protein
MTIFVMTILIMTILRMTSHIISLLMMTLLIMALLLMMLLMMTLLMMLLNFFLHYRTHTLQIHNLRQKDRFHSKLVSFLFLVTNTLAYCGIHI